MQALAYKNPQSLMHPVMLENLGYKNPQSLVHPVMLVNLQELQNLMTVNPVGSTMVFGSNGVTQNGVDVTNSLDGVSVTTGPSSTGTVYHTETGSSDFSQTGSSTSSGSSSTTVSPTTSTTTSSTTTTGAIYMQAVAATLMGVMISMFWKNILIEIQ